MAMKPETVAAASAWLHMNHARWALRGDWKSTTARSPRTRSATRDGGKPPLPSPNAGGGIYLPASTCGGCGCPSYTFSMTNSLVQANKITGMCGDPYWQPTGAGIYFESLALPEGWNPEAIEKPVMIMDCVIRNNSAQSGAEGTPFAADLGVGGAMKWQPGICLRHQPLGWRLLRRRHLRQCDQG